MSSPDDPQLTLSRLAFELATAALARQQQVLDDLRRRGAALFGNWVLTADGTFAFLSWGGILCAAVAAAHATAVILPRLDLELELRPLVVLSGVEHVGLIETPGGIHHVLARHLDAAHQRNEPAIARIASYLHRSVIFMAVAALCWVANLATGA
ncbi:hypothetical protein [Conexibacter woesei]|uniref:Uncharacterized protein n=1 Tax=Conexibacter woesei (strain DSM 14684 / CCUG 47730 / CIP 108061 / JCM 11494 / NBRC 100937 / ID131577) TaxID=469383 RepID=D3F228_CONWI|nr:hypothetical protein [Conexibacter woesei]ADB50203.1 hypothetical protein Cwoe_1777 [Conexibacter woesei DSM 14684]